jgi:hypothetical protein
MRLPLLVAVAAATACGRRQDVPPVSPVYMRTSGAATAFGRGILAVHPGALIVSLARPAHVIVVRVWPRDTVELVYPSGLRDWRAYGQEPREFGTQRVGRGEWHIVLPVPSVYAVSSRFGKTPGPYRTPRRGFPQGACMLQPTMAPGPPPERVFCQYLGLIDPLDPPDAEHWMPRPLDPHFLVLIAADAAFDLDAVRAQLAVFDILSVRKEAAPDVVLESLLGGRAAWGAWVVHQP